MARVNEGHIVLSATHTFIRLSTNEMSHPAFTPLHRTLVGTVLISRRRLVSLGGGLHTDMVCLPKTVTDSAAAGDRTHDR